MRYDTATYGAIDRDRRRTAAVVKVLKMKYTNLTAEDALTFAYAILEAADKAEEDPTT